MATRVIGDYGGAAAAEDGLVRGDCGAGLGEEAETGPFIGMDEWTRVSEVWPPPDPDDPEAPMEIAARLADYVDAIEPVRQTGGR